MSVAAALATIELLEQELVDNAGHIGARLMDKLRDLPKRFPIVGDVRGLGLMIGIELVRDQVTKESDRVLAHENQAKPVVAHRVEERAVWPLAWVVVGDRLPVTLSVRGLDEDP